MKLSDFDYHLPETNIAQFPLAERDASRMLVLHRSTGKIEHRQFKNFPEYFKQKDLLVFNQSKVIKARLLGERQTGGKVEVFLLKALGENKFECLLRSYAKEKIGLTVHFAKDFSGKILERTPRETTFVIQLYTHLSMEEVLEQYGRLPLPPYITRDPNREDEERYQTLHAREAGSVAAPTAGLHFTDEIKNKLQNKGIGLAYVTLHVGLGTFQPIQVEDIREHKMHEEFFSIDDETLAKIQKTQTVAGRIVAVGTTTVRTLESKTATGWTSIFIKPGDTFHNVDVLFTNFHQPRSSLFVLVSAFAGRELIKLAYQEALRENYRFLSYGDCMLIL